MMHRPRSKREWIRLWELRCNSGRCDIKMIYESCVRRSHLAQIAINFWALHKWPKWPQSPASWYRFFFVFLATLHILAGQRAKSQMWAWITNWENEHSWGFMSEHAQETGSDKGLEKEGQEVAAGVEGGGGGGGNVSSCCLGRRLTKYKSGGKSSGMQ